MIYINCILFGKLHIPYFFKTTYEEWKESLLNDIDGEGRKLFADTTLKGAYMNGELVGFIQYGISKFGFDENGEISDKIHYQIIRNIYFDRNFSNAGELLLNSALEEFNSKERIYAFFTILECLFMRDMENYLKNMII